MAEKKMREPQVEYAPRKVEHAASLEDIQKDREKALAENESTDED